MRATYLMLPFVPPRPAGPAGAGSRGLTSMRMPINSTGNFVKFMEALEAATSGAGVITAGSVAEGTLRRLVAAVCPLGPAPADRSWPFFTSTFSPQFLSGVLIEVGRQDLFADGAEMHFSPAVLSHTLRSLAKLMSRSSTLLVTAASVETMDNAAVAAAKAVVLVDGDLGGLGAGVAPSPARLSALFNLSASDVALGGSTSRFASVFYVAPPGVAILDDVGNPRAAAAAVAAAGAVLARLGGGAYALSTFLRDARIEFCPVSTCAADAAYVVDKAEVARLHAEGAADLFAHTLPTHVLQFPALGRAVHGAGDGDPSDVVANYLALHREAAVKEQPFSFAGIAALAARLDKLPGGDLDATRQLLNLQGDAAESKVRQVESLVAHPIFMRCVAAVAADPGNLLGLVVAADFVYVRRLLAEGPDKLPKALAGLPLFIDVAKNRHLLGASLQQFFYNNPSLRDVTRPTEPPEHVVRAVLTGTLTSALGFYGQMAAAFCPTAFADKGSRVFGSSNDVIFSVADDACYALRLFRVTMEPLFKQFGYNGFTEFVDDVCNRVELSRGRSGLAPFVASFFDAGMKAASSSALACLQDARFAAVFAATFKNADTAFHAAAFEKAFTNHTAASEFALVLATSSLSAGRLGGASSAPPFAPPPPPPPASWALGGAAADATHFLTSALHGSPALLLAPPHGGPTPRPAGGGGPRDARPVSRSAAPSSASLSLQQNGRLTGALEPGAKRARAEPGHRQLPTLPDDAPFSETFVLDGAAALRIGILAFDMRTVHKLCHGSDQCTAPLVIRKSFGRAQPSVHDFHQVRASLCRCPTAAGHESADSALHRSPQLSEHIAGVFGSPARWRDIAPSERARGKTNRTPGFGRPLRGK